MRIKGQRTKRNRTKRKRTKEKRITKKKSRRRSLKRRKGNTRKKRRNTRKMKGGNPEIALKLSLSQLRERGETLSKEQMVMDLSSQKKTPSPDSVNSRLIIGPAHDIVNVGYEIYKEYSLLDNVVILPDGNQCLIFFDLSNHDHEPDLQEFIVTTPGLDQKVSGKNYCVLLISGNIIEGYVLATETKDHPEKRAVRGTLFSDKKESVVYVNKVQIYSGLKGKGFCKILVKYMLESLKRLGKSNIYLWEVADSHIAACKCYYKAGIESGFKVRLEIQDNETLLLTARGLGIKDPEKYDTLKLKNLIKDKYGWKTLTHEIQSDEGCYLKGAARTFYYYSLD